MISVKMMKIKSRVNLRIYGTDEHIYGIGMATKENEKAMAYGTRASEETVSSNDTKEKNKITSANENFASFVGDKK